MWSELVQAAEPAPQGWSAAGEMVFRHAEQRPDVFWPVVAVALPLLLVTGIGLIVVRWLLPAWREEKKADRDALVTALRQRGEEAAKDAEKDRELAKIQNDAIVQRIENKVERVTGELSRIDARVERHGEMLSPSRELGPRVDRLSTELAQLSTNIQRILAKLGIGAVLAVVLCTPRSTVSHGRKALPPPPGPTLPAAASFGASRRAHAARGGAISPPGSARSAAASLNPRSPPSRGATHDELHQ